MEVEIVHKKDNPLLERLEVEFRVTHDKEQTPKRKEVRAKLADLAKADKERVVIDHMNSEFGKAESQGYAKVYKTKEKAQEVERESVLKRHGMNKGAAETEGAGEKKE